VKARLLAIVVALALIGFLLVRSGGDRPTPETDRALPTDDAPAPSLREGALAARPPATPTADETPVSPTPSGFSNLVVELRYPPLPDGESLLVSLSLRTKHDDGPHVSWWRTTKGMSRFEGSAAPGAERLESAVSSETVRLRGLESRSATIVAVVSAGGEEVAASAPVRFDLRSGENRAVLELVPRSDFATIAFSVSDGGDPVEGARIQVHVEGIYWPSVRTDASGKAEASVPGNSAIRTWIDSFPGQQAVSAPPEQSFRITPRERREVSFELPPTVRVKFRAVAPDGAEVNGGGIAGIWSLRPGERPRYVGFILREAPDGTRWHRLPPGRYGIRFAGAGDLAAAWHEFVVAPGDPVTVSVPLARGGRRVRIRLRGPDGGPPMDRSTPAKPIGSIVLSRPAIDHPSEMAIGSASLDAEGRGETQVLPDGPYEVHVWPLHLHRRIEVAAGATDFDLRLPPALDHAKSGGLEGRASEVLGRQLRAVVGGEEWSRSADFVNPERYRFAFLPAGTVTLRAEPSPYTGGFRPYEATVRIEHGAVATHDVIVDER